MERLARDTGAPVKKRSESGRADIVVLDTMGELAVLYGAADVFLLPTLYDPFCNAIMEAMACGLPVVVGEEAGAAEIVRRGESGFVIDNERDPAKTAGQLTTALEARDRMGREAARDAAGRTMERYAERLMALLNEARREEI